MSAQRRASGGTENRSSGKAVRNGARVSRRRARVLLPFVTGILILVSWAKWRTGEAEQLTPQVVARYAHDSQAYTQGLLWWDGYLYESTGRYGQSSLRKVELETGRVVRQRRLPAAFFGEGLERVDDQLIQLTWHENLAFVYSLPDFEKVKEFEYRGEGWGLCRLGDKLYMSNGSETLTIRDAETFLVVGRVRVTVGGKAVEGLNELECAQGSVWANVWTTDTILRIDPDRGRVTATVDASNLNPERPSDGEAVLNGIAYRPETGTFLLTGKLWPDIFEVRFVRR